MIYIQLDGPYTKTHQRKSGSMSFFEKLSLIGICVAMIVIVYILTVKS